jgi:cytidylate kinase
MYRAMTLRVLEEGIPVDDVDRIGRLAKRTRVRLERKNGSNAVFVDGRDVSKAIRSREVTKSVSVVSSYQSVRSVLVREQRRMAAEGGVVLEGRDIGTVVLPDADLKIYMVAEVAERARRRKKEFETAGVEANEEEIRSDLVRRDELDSTRPVSPLRKATDAIELDTSNLSVDEQVEFIVKKAQRIIAAKK